MIGWWKSPHALWLKDILRPLLPRFGEVMAVSFFSNMLALAVPLFTLQVYDRVVGHNGISTLYALVVGVLLALGFDYLLRQARSRMLQSTALHIDAHLGRALYHKLTSLPLLTLESRPTSYWQSLFQDAATVRGVFSGPAALLLADLPFAIIFIVVICIIAMPIAWVLLLVVPLFLLLTWFSSHVQDVDTAKERHKGLHRDAMVAELMGGRTTVKALMIDKIIAPKWEDVHAESITQAYERGSRTDGFISLGHSLMMLTTVMMVTTGALAIIEREMTIGSLIAANMLASRIIAPLNQLLGNWKNYAACKQAIVRLDRLFHLDSEREEAGIERERPMGHMAVEQFTFGYDAQQPILEEVSCLFQPGEMTALVGRNGCGKTTLIKCLQGLYEPQKGRILLDNADISQFTREQLSQWVGYVPQECFLFDGTIRDNITKSWPEAPDEVVLKAAKLADADGFISDLPDGYATEIGEGGFKLSGGQRQRLAIARALLKNPPVLLFDEITSNLDNEAEMRLAQTIRELATHRTIILATHSIPLLTMCHRIIVLERGRIAMMGPGDKVMARLSGKPDDAHPQTTQASPQSAAPAQPSAPATAATPQPAAPSGPATQQPHTPAAPMPPTGQGGTS